MQSLASTLVLYLSMVRYDTAATATSDIVAFSSIDVIKES
jgi:hypothetical protein